MTPGVEPEQLVLLSTGTEKTGGQASKEVVTDRQQASLQRQRLSSQA